MNARPIGRAHGGLGGGVDFTVSEEAGWWRRFVGALPMRVSLAAVAVVWLLGCVWSYQEQSAFAASHQFQFPHLLPLVIDGFAASVAGVSWAASLDARPAIPARLVTVIAVGASSVSNGVWAWLRAHHDPVTVALGVAVPIAAAMAFEVLLAELRRRVQRHRGLPDRVVVPYPRLIRFVLAPLQTFRAWRQLVLRITAIEDPEAFLSDHTGDHETDSNSVTSLLAGPGTGSGSELAVRAVSKSPLAVNVADLLPVSREIAAEPDKAGSDVSREALIRGLRARGLTCSTDRGTALAAILKAERAERMGQLEVVS